MGKQWGRGSTLVGVPLGHGRCRRGVVILLLWLVVGSRRSGSVLALRHAVGGKDFEVLGVASLFHRAGFWSLSPAGRGLG